jgi:hypothetical protein
MEERNGMFILSVKDGFGAADLSKIAFEKGIALTHILERKRRLEEEFLQITSRN